MNRYRETQQHDKRDKFLSELVGNGVLSKLDMKKKGKSPKLSKLIEIGENDYLQRKKVRPLLPPSYSTLYYICQLARQLDKRDPVSAELNLLRILERYRGALDSRTVQHELRKHKATSKRKTSPSTSTGNGRSSTISIGDLVKSGSTFDLMLITPSPSDISLLKEDYSEGYLDECFPLARLIAERTGSSLVVLVIEVRWMRVAHCILSLAGRRDADQTLLLGKPQSPDISSSKLALLSFAGKDSSKLRSSQADWIDAKRFRTLLQEEHPKLTRRLHVFADAQTPGWVALKGEHNWSSVPKLKT